MLGAPDCQALSGTHRGSVEHGGQAAAGLGDLRGGGADDLEELEQPQPGLLPFLPRVGAHGLQRPAERGVDIPQGQGGVGTGQGGGQIRGRGVGRRKELADARSAIEDTRLS